MAGIITEGLLELKDEDYRAFHAKLIPNIPIEKIIGVRTPVLRKYAKEVAKLPEAEAFLWELPHTYYEENNLLKDNLYQNKLACVIAYGINQYLEQR